MRSFLPPSRPLCYVEFDPPTVYGYLHPAEVLFLLDGGIGPERQLSERARSILEREEELLAWLKKYRKEKPTLPKKS